jgi:glycosidase
MSSPEWVKTAIFYHIYPLGLSGAPAHNDFNAPPVHRLDDLIPWLDHIQSLGGNALYLGPVFQSTRHGYDTADYYQVDRRLGNRETLARFAAAVHQRGMKLVLDGVFNHVGRNFWAFKDLQAHGQDSPYRDWFHNLRFEGRSPNGDPFQYEGWHGHYSLVKLNLAHPHVRDHLFDAVGLWMAQFGIDGLRLDAADCLDFDFMAALRDFTKSRRSDFWLMGEVIHGDYGQWANPHTLDSVTNYEAYKGLYSSLVDANYFEIAHTLDRQFGSPGIYRHLDLYNFVDNHDVDRVASKLASSAHLYPLYLLLFTMPGIPAIYYGSEWGLEGVKADWSDAPLRPSLDLDALRRQSPQRHLPGVIRRLADLRQQFRALTEGEYRLLHVDHRQIVFERRLETETLVIALNSADQPFDLCVDFDWDEGFLEDILNTGEGFTVREGQASLSLPAAWGRVLKVSPS